MKLSVVIPLFNEEAVIGTTCSAVLNTAARLISERLIEDYEIILVDDGSNDRSLEIIKNIASASDQVKIISFSRNFGHQPALAAGINHSSGNVVVSLDADLQDPPDLIGEMIRRHLDGKDIVYAVRRKRAKDNPFKRLTAHLFYSVMQTMGVDLIYDHADYRLISKKVATAFRKLKETNIFLRGIFPYMGFNHDIVYYERENRYAGATKYPLGKMLAFAWEGITSFTNIPLRLAFFSGLIISLSSILIVGWALYEKFSGNTVPGWTSTVIPIFFIGGLNILFLGLIGEYIGKIYLEVKGRPLYFINETVNLDVKNH